MRTFVLRFLVAFALLEALVLLVLTRANWFAPYAEVNARLTALLLAPFMEGTQALGAMLFTPSFSIAVRPGCDSYQASAVFLAGVVAFPAARARKWIGALVGVGCLMALNLLRLAALLWTGVHRPASFEFMHLEVLPIVFVGASLGLLLGWALWARA